MNRSEGAISASEILCATCQTVKTDDVVQCDRCSKWHHFECVKVTSDVSEKSWACANCTEESTNPSSAATVTAISKPPSSRKGSSSSKSRQRLLMKHLEEEERLSLISDQLQQRKAQLERKEIEREEEKLNQTRSRQRKKFELMLSCVDDEGSLSDEGSVGGTERTGNMEKADAENEDCAEAPESSKPANDARVIAVSTAEQRAMKARAISTPAPELANHVNDWLNATTPQLTQVARHFAQRPTEQSRLKLPTQQQLLARQMVPSKLPQFSGAVEEWPSFFSAYQQSTEMCGLTDAENLLRLKESLKGDAWKAVYGRLLHPDNVPGAIEALQRRFGKPDRIIEATAQQIKALEPPCLERPVSVVDFALALDNLLATVKACGIKEFVHDRPLLRELERKLPPVLKHCWGGYVKNHPTPSLENFSQWINSEADNSNSLMEDYVVDEKPVQDGRTVKPGPPCFKCVVCLGTCSSLARCTRFIGFNVHARWDVVRAQKLCCNCLKKHPAPCYSKISCRQDGCGERHHQLLHTFPATPGDVNTPERTDSRQEPNRGARCNTHQTVSRANLFRIAPVILYGPKKKVETFALFDDAADVTLVEESLAKELELDGPTSTLCLEWTSGIVNRENSKKVNLKISSSPEGRIYNIDVAHTMANLGLRSQTLDAGALMKKYPHLAGLDVRSYTNAQPRILIGSDYASIGVARKSREGKYKEPVAVKTRVGWIIYGSVGETDKADSFHSCLKITRCRCEDSLRELHLEVKQHFSLENLGIFKGPVVASDEQQREKKLLNAITQQTNGRYQTGLLWRYDHVVLPNSELMALKRWECLKAKMKRDPGLMKAMEEKMTDYLKKGYARQLTQQELQKRYSRVWYLPIFPVFNANKPGKLRIVWDAAASVKGVSLNSRLLKGPDQITNLLAVLIRFRERQVGVCGDIREMFHQVLVNGQDQHCQRFFWKSPNSEGPPNTYVMQVMTFGASCSPCIAQFVKNTNAQKFKSQYPEAVQAIIEQHYVDDMLISTDSENKAIELATQVSKIHFTAGFEMRNWVSNSSAVLTALNEGGQAGKCLDLGNEKAEKVLGLWWDTKDDCFTFQQSPKLEQKLASSEERPTKRQILCILMSIFDPLGFVAHFLMQLKALIQEVWRSGIGWDEQIPQQLGEKWHKWARLLPKLAEIRIPRCYSKVFGNGEIEMHTFVDASETGFAAVSYIRIIKGGVIECSFAAAKTKVAPLKFLSIPRSELQAAVLGVRIANTVMKSLSIPVLRRFFWSDSKDVLCWIRSDHRKYNQFVACRVSEILESTEENEWKWVPTKENVADEGTKWAKEPVFDATSRWWRGPDFLWCKADKWPQQLNCTETATTTSELRVRVNYHKSTPTPLIDPSLFSEWGKLVRHTALVIRFAENLKRKVKGERLELDSLTGDELHAGEKYLYKTAQYETYAKEIHVLQQSSTPNLGKGKTMKFSCINMWNPYVDKEGLLRSRGRGVACKFTNFDVHNPIILPRHHYITELVIARYHQRYMHRNHETILNEIRQRFRIPQLKTVYRTIRSRCQFCKNFSAKPLEPMMAELPHGRVAAFSAPFTHMGIDYFGPYVIAVGRKTEKRWGVLATCLTTRAVHLEVASSLTTDSCVMAIRNVWARKGTPAVIYSDRGTNFQGASKEIKAALTLLDHTAMYRRLSAPGIQWRFNTPAAPHMGGAWERLVQSVKRNLVVVLPGKRPTHEVLVNALTEIENILNSRPLTSIPLDDDDSPVLTPNHFLLGSSNGMRSWTPLDDRPHTLKRSWLLSQEMADTFWKQWLRDYLPTITGRSKWQNQAKPIRVGDIVVIADEQQPRNSWPKGRVIGVRQAADGQVRSATVQTIHGCYERPAVKLAVLDVQGRHRTATETTEQ